MKRFRRVVQCAVLLSAVATAAGAQPPPPGVDAALDSLRAARGGSLEVALLTMGPGNAVFERFGHNAIAIRDTLTGESLAYNWGMFDFDQPNFLGRFLMGESRYWLGVYRTDDMLNAYRAENRSIRYQRLALTPVERAALQDFVRWNSQEQNAFYRYDYYNDNCSTRVRDALDRTLLGQIDKQLGIQGDGRTWRSETERVLSGSIPAYAGIQLALGRGADVSLTKWQEAFLPEHLADALATMPVSTADGRRMRLVRVDTMLFRAERRPMPSEPPQWLSIGLLLGLMGAGLIALLADSPRTTSRVALSVGVGVWYVITGIAGTALLLAATVTKHAAYMGSTSTLLVINPLCLIAAFLVPMALWRRTPRTSAFGVATGIAALSIVALLLQLVPGFRQHNGLVLATIVPVQIALAFAVYRLGHISAQSRYSAS